LVSREAGKQLLKYRDKIASSKFEEIWLEKSIFKYLTWASMCFRAGIPIGTICLCRTAIETGLRERVAEEMAKKDKLQKDISQKVVENLRKLEKRVSFGRKKKRKGINRLSGAI
jgi:hypothetical protein